MKIVLFLLVLFFGFLGYTFYSKKERLQMPISNQTQKLTMNDVLSMQKNVVCVSGDKLVCLKQGNKIYSPSDDIIWGVSGDHVSVSGANIPMDDVVETVGVKGVVVGTSDFEQMLRTIWG